ncbi:hypothetical protein IWW37_003997 [Coemansia sp. RSA 2050]|nr:hypothetical protein IWW37_003997 [Coemansia sp. RSA 2050]
MSPLLLTSTNPFPVLLTSIHFSDNVEPAPVMSFSDVGEHTESADASDMEELAKELAEDFISDNSGLYAEVFKFYDVDVHATKFGTMEEHAQFAEISSANDSVATPNFSDFFNFSPAAESQM